MQLKDKVAVVTGASGDIGKKILEEVLQRRFRYICISEKYR